MIRIHNKYLDMNICMRKVTFFELKVVEKHENGNVENGMANWFQNRGLPYHEVKSKFTNLAIIISLDL